MSSTVIRVGAAPEQFRKTAQFLDGITAEPQTVQISIDETRRALVWITADDDRKHWPLDSIREVPDQAGGDILVLRLRDDATQRLILADRDILPRLLYRTRRAPVTKRGRLITWAIGAIASVALIILVLVPNMADQLANYIPPEGERALGDATLEQIRSALNETGIETVPFCTNPEGQTALGKMQTRLTENMDTPPDITVHVLDHDLVNAFALPGGHIVLFRGLIDAADQPEQIAAVFAHEIGHVVSRDPTRHALRSAGSIGVLGLLFGDFAGGAVVLFLTERLIDAQYSQAAEAGADVFAHDMMKRAGLAPSALAEMFERFRTIGGDSEGFVAHFLSHPELGDRIAAANAATPKNFERVPLLSGPEWQALQNICE